MAQQIVFRAEFFREGDLYVGLAPELNVSSFGETLDEAKESLKEAVDGFLEECETMGTLEDVIEEAGFEKTGNQWLPRQPIAAELLTAG
jgi:predicted RNase H-like HicB family nuclease